jgi:hypothetical protein
MFPRSQLRLGNLHVTCCYELFVLRRSQRHGSRIKGAAFFHSKDFVKVYTSTWSPVFRLLFNQSNFMMWSSTAIFIATLVGATNAAPYVVDRRHNMTYNGHSKMGPIRSSICHLDKIQEVRIDSHLRKLLFLTRHQIQQHSRWPRCPQPVEGGFAYSSNATNVRKIV